MIRMRIITPDGRLMEHELTSDALVIGRSSMAGLPLPDPSLSREHARLYQNDGRWFVEDLGSRNGTYLEGRRLEQAVPLEPGQTLRMGGCTVAIEENLRPASNTGAAAADGTIFRPASELLDQSRFVPTEAEAAGDVALRRYAERLKLVFDVQQSLARSESIDELLDQMLAGVFNHLRPVQGAVFLKTADGEFRRAASRSSLPGAPDFVLSRSLIREVAGKGLATLATDVRTDERFAEAVSILGSGVRSLVAAPLIGPEGSLGMIALGSNATVRKFTEEDMELLVSLASVAALRLRNIALAAEAAERKRLEAEVNLARRIQLALLPDRLPEVSGYDMYGSSVPSRVTSGDFYKAAERLDGKECVLFLADVSGKGLPAALVTGALESLSAGPLETGLGPGETFNRVSRRLYARTTPEKYATAFLAVLDVASGRVTFANAGHNPPLLVKASGETSWLQATGTPLGLLPVGDYTEESVDLSPGDLLTIYTDGITEANSPDGEEFGKERLAEALCTHAEETPDKVAEALGRELDSFAAGTPFGDDRTLLMIKRKK